MPAQEEVEEIESSRKTGNAFTNSTLAKTADIDARIISDAPVAAAPSPPPATPEPEIEIPQAAKPAKKPPEVKHVKMRSSVDVMAELEALRKRATQSPSSSSTIPYAGPRMRSRHSVRLSWLLSRAATFAR